MTQDHILACRWYTPGGLLPTAGLCVGAVLVEYPHDGYVQAYIGIGEGWNEEADKQHIAEWGAKLEPDVAREMFPQFQFMAFNPELMP